MFKALDVVVLKKAVPGTNIPAGAEGVIVHIHSVPRTAYMVEFCNGAVETTDLVSLLPSQIALTQALRSAA